LVQALLVSRALVDDLVGVDGGLDHALGGVGLGVLHYRHYSLAVNDGLDFINYVRPHSLLQAGRHFNDASHARGRSLLDVLLNVVDHIPVDLAVDDGLHLHDAVLPDGLLDHRGIVNSLLLHDRLASHALLLESLLLELLLLEALLLHARLVSSVVLVLVGNLV